MNSYKLTKKLKDLRKETYLTSTDQALFHELVSICNEKRWPEVFSVKNEILCSALNMTEKTLIKSRKTLIAGGLLFSDSIPDKRYGCKYSFHHEISTGKIPAETTGENDKSPEVSTGKYPADPQIPPYYNIKTINKESSIHTHACENPPSNNPKSRKSKPKESALLYVHHSPEFISTWEMLRNTPKWKRKSSNALQISLDKLARYPEEFAIELIKRSIECGWAGVVYTPGTDNEFEAWKTLKYSKYEENRKLSKSDQRRMLLEEYAAIVSQEAGNEPEPELFEF